MRTEVSRIQNNLGTTTVYVTHDQTEAMTLGDRVAVMRAGVLQQVGSPTELYNDPANLFVAGFIGSPAMNFMAARIEDGVAKLPIGDLPLSDALRAGAPSGQTVVAGIRPENFEDASLVGDGRERGITFRAKIDIVESVGSENYVYFQTAGESVRTAELEELARDAGADEVPSSGEGQVVARLDAASPVSRGDEAELWVDASKLHLFDPSTGTHLARR
jgi:multiple sugar transport system ATP-binding protein